MMRKDRNFSKPEDFADEIGETMKTFEEFAQYLRDEDEEAGQTGMLVATEYEAKVEKHLRCLQQLFDEFRCSRGSMLTIRQFIAACALAHNLDCNHYGWEYEYDYEEWFDDVVGVVMQPSCAVWLSRPGPDGSMQIQQVDIDVEKLNRAAELIGYLDIF